MDETCSGEVGGDVYISNSSIDGENKAPSVLKRPFRHDMLDNDWNACLCLELWPSGNAWQAADIELLWDKTSKIFCD